MDQVTQQNAALVEEASAAASTLSDQAKQLAKLAGQFNTGSVSSTATPKTPSSVTQPITKLTRPTPAKRFIPKTAPAPTSVKPNTDSNDWEEF